MDSQPSSNPQVVTVDVHAAKALIGSGYRYLDVRTEEEFTKGHVDVENSLNIAYMFNTPQGRVKNPQFLEQVMAACKKDDFLVVGCQSGVRSVYASVDLLKVDFKNVSNMGGGYLAWVENKLGVKKVSEEEQRVEQKVNEEKIVAKKVVDECHDQLKSSFMPETSGEIKIL